MKITLHTRCTQSLNLTQSFLFIQKRNSKRRNRNWRQSLTSTLCSLSFAFTSLSFYSSFTFIWPVNGNKEQVRGPFKTFCSKHWLFTFILLYYYSYYFTLCAPFYSILIFALFFRVTTTIRLLPTGGLQHTHIQQSLVSES